MESLEFTESKIKWPFVRQCDVGILGVGKRDILVDGVIRIWYDTKEFKDATYPFPELIRLICLWYEDEYIYFLSKNIGCDYVLRKRIALNQVLSNNPYHHYHDQSVDIYAQDML